MGVAACRGKKNIPDVSGIKIVLPVQRFDKDFFSLDTNNISAGMSRLGQKYPVMLPLFLQNIIGTSDTAGIKTFIRLSQKLNADASKIFERFDDVKKDIETGLKFVKHYFPDYKLPDSIITILGPPDAMAQTTSGEPTPVFLRPGFIGISLQFYMGKDYPMYQDEFFISTVAPLYRSRRFEKQFIAGDVFKLIADDIYPDKALGKPLIEQFIEKGKQSYLIDHLLPFIADSIKTGYTQKQLEWCQKNEGDIWAYIIANENLNSVEPVVVQTYIGESPFTQGMSQSSPGNIGQWVGWQIIKKFAEKNPELSLQQILNTEARKILDEAKYKPK